MALAPGQTTLAAVRLAVRQRADMVHSQFVTDDELNGYIRASHFELYDLLVQKYGDDYHVAVPHAFVTDGAADRYALPDDFYKLLGVDLLAHGDYVSLRPFAFADRNRRPGLRQPGTRDGLRYRLSGTQLWLSPLPTAGQTLRVWYVPRLTPLAADDAVLDGVSGWEEYVVVDAAIKCLQKEESDVSVLLAQKAALVRRIESAAENRDAGAPATVVDSQRLGLHDASEEWWL